VIPHSDAARVIAGVERDEPFEAVPAVPAGAAVDVDGHGASSRDHGAQHRFVDIQEELQLLVVFAPPESPDD
jgi:hypothetical protein